MSLDLAYYRHEVASILKLEQSGERLIPLVSRDCSSSEARAQLHTASAAQLFPDCRDPHAAFCGLWLYFSCSEEAHSIAQDCHTPNGSFWHAILHRQEPDPANAAYWFRRVGDHPVFPALRSAADRLQQDAPGPLPLKSTWDPFAFIDFCETARTKPGSPAERLALKIQRAEWQLLFDYCARPA